MVVNPYVQLQSAFTALARLAESAGNAELATRAKYYGQRVQARTFTIAFVGEFKAGKSTLVNAMCGHEILPTATRECTAVVTRVRSAQDGESAGVIVTLEDGAHHEAALEDLEEALSIKGGRIFRRKHVQEAEVRLDKWRWADFDVAFVDTPGVNAGPKMRDASVLKYLPAADAIVFVTRADQLLNASEQKFLSEEVVRDDLTKLFVVINRADELGSDAERLGVQNKARAILAKILPSQPRVLLTSAADYADGLEDGDADLVAASGVPALEDTLRSFLRDDRIEAELQTSRSMLSGLLKELERGLKRAETNASMGIERIRDRAKRFDRAIEHVRSDGAKLSSESSTILENQMLGPARSAISSSMSSLKLELERMADDEGVSQQALISKAQSGLRAAGVKLEGLVRERGLAVQRTLAERLKATFDGAEVEIEDDSDSSQAMVPVDASSLASMISVQAIQVQEEHEVEDTENRLVNAGVGALFLGGLAALIFPPAGIAIAAAIGANMGSQRATKMVKRMRTERQTQGIPQAVKKAEEQLNHQLKTVAGRTSTQLSGVVDRLVKSKLAELEHQRAQLADGDPAELENKRREAAEHLNAISKLKQQHLPEGA